MMKESNCLYKSVSNYFTLYRIVYRPTHDENLDQRSLYKALKVLSVFVNYFKDNSKQEYTIC